MADAPERIWAAVNGASTRLPDGGRQLIGGWSEDPERPRVTEYIRADLASPTPSLPEDVARVVDGLNELSRQMVKLDMDMSLPEGSLDPREGSALIQSLSSQLAETRAERDNALVENRKARRLISATHKNAVKHEHCESLNCHICDGGLFVCADCGAAEIETEERICTGIEEMSDLHADAAAAEAELALVRKDRDRLAAENEALKRMAFWFMKYPEFKPNPEMMEDVCADIERAKPFIPSTRTALASLEDRA